MKESYHPFRSQKAKETYLACYDEHAKRWPIALETKMVKTSFGQTFVRISGPEDGPPLVLLPGDSENSLAWIPQIAELSVDYRTYALDHIFDNGRSIYTRPMKKPSDFVQWLDEFFTALELNNINLMGFSYGGWQASLYALAYPQSLNKLVLIASVGVLPARLEVLVRGMIYYFIPTRFIIRRYLYWYNADAVKKDETTREAIDNMVNEALLSFKCFKRRSFVPPTVLTDKDWQNLKVPTLFLVGENEVTYSAQKAIRHLNKVAPKVKTLITPDAGHDLAIVKPEWISNEVLKFLTNQ
ncbi:MAG: alpha/beta fold hydrolase [Candidatus Aminicenantes bacterium]|nr:alpha/beta fold hydrolase [Candidatus Aminicenantes bacterium]NIM84338.1 alpha/beta fold hydrolase [Candidatus Aminicenantes bacterium]NIN23824.1 alpha/beta fold hydrolase [Candidatus Aminicenantes bacterium]NIN47540.1 alpha/beta fold hydrolase [Candidatus Aminicenantes bacterium]NIN90460.1 alpha/beta fold hydrolase [Candidatus Aminicenantes bacterium]